MRNWTRGGASGGGAYGYYGQSGGYGGYQTQYNGAGYGRGGGYRTSPQYAVQGGYGLVLCVEAMKGKHMGDVCFLSLPQIPTRRLSGVCVRVRVCVCVCVCIYPLHSFESLVCNLLYVIPAFVTWFI